MTLGVNVDQTMEEKIREFRSDSQKMDVTNKFVNDVVEKAKDEAAKRMKERDRDKAMNSERGSTRKRGRWHSRARGFFTRMFSSLCFCNTDTKV